MSRRRRASGSPIVTLLVVGGSAVVVIAVVIGALVLFGGNDAKTGTTAVPDGYPYPVQAIARIADRAHFPVGQVYSAYNSNPPTSGEHAAAAAPNGISDAAVAKEMAVHNMEHAGVVVWYNCEAPPVLPGDDCTALRNELSAVVQTAIGNGQKVLMTPYPDMDQRIALTAWGFLDAFEEFDAARVQKFIETFECNFDPEGFC